MNLHPKHGFNPAIQNCFWCGESKGVLLLGAAIKDEAPREMVTDYEPCDKCAESFKQGILVVEASETPLQANQPILDQGYPTGSYWVVTSDWVKRSFKPDIAETIIKANKMMISKEFADMLGFHEVEDTE